MVYEAKYKTYTKSNMGWYEIHCKLKFKPKDSKHLYKTLRNEIGCGFKVRGKNESYDDYIQDIKNKVEDTDYMAEFVKKMMQQYFIRKYNQKNFDKKRLKALCNSWKDIEIELKPN